jgi:hypothetical protein
MWLAIGTTRRRKAGVTVLGRDHHVAGDDRAARCLDPPPGAIRRNPLDRGLGADRDVAPPAGIEQPLVVERRMQARRALDHHAAIIIVAGDLVALALANHQQDRPALVPPDETVSTAATRRRVRVSRTEFTLVSRI